MRTFLIAGALVCAMAAMVAQGAIQVPSGYEAEALGQNFMGGFDYLPNGDIIGMYTDPMMIEKSYIGIYDANGDGLPSSIDKIYEFGQAIFGGFVKVSPDGRFALACDTSDYKVYSIDVTTRMVSELTLTSGSFIGAWDLAFIDNEHCYVSANPGGIGSTINNIYQLDIPGRQLKEIISVSPTYSGPVDVDDAGNLYYVRGKGSFPAPKPGDFTVLKFSSARLAAALSQSTILGPTDAEEVVGNLDGGFDVAWHSSGDLYISDGNHGKIFRVARGGEVSEFASLPGEMYEGFNILSFHRRDQAFAPSTPTHAELSATYLSFGSSPPETYRITSLPPILGVMVNATTLVVGSHFALSVAVQPAPQPFDAYVVFKGGGAYYSLTPKGLVKGVRAYAVAVPGLKQPLTKTILDMPIGSGIPAGVWIVYAGLMPKGTAPSPANAFALDTIEVTIE